ncbi:conserved hypothetical protein [Neospora caninum Liverpool]|uniref:Transmembrane protein n=1 Tax=Neospora caninum (strain Liverpool) TaxID=572307 RepID=F0VDN8_NEOCL|nr:conserved hypothetical protein [Neospora caninum Liverpool]CBZ51831.1 conserved hypothetical protein [Neospora caninum Liverpool]CEL65789.1 TPA: hypothetical protein BN1204_016230 [Neospora caninum Liverpool]|eukprot:XP_003881864.1 conserved hypothetical protein [Neospora caninum Liverpool]
MATLHYLRVLASPCVSLLSLGCGCLGVYEGWRLRERKKVVDAALKDSSSVAAFAAKTADQYAGICYTLPTPDKGVSEFQISVLSPALLASLQAAVTAGGIDACTVDESQITAALAATEVLSRQLSATGGNRFFARRAEHLLGEGPRASVGRRLEPHVGQSGDSAATRGEDARQGICLGRIAGVGCVSKPLKISADGVQTPGRYLQVTYQYFVPVSEGEASVEAKLRQVLELQEALEAAKIRRKRDGESPDSPSFLGRGAEPEIVGQTALEAVREARQSGVLSPRQRAEPPSEAETASWLTWISSLVRRASPSADEAAQPPASKRNLLVDASTAAAPRIVVMEGQVELRLPRGDGRVHRWLSETKQLRAGDAHAPQRSAAPLQKGERDSQGNEGPPDAAASTCESSSCGTEAASVAARAQPAPSCGCGESASPKTLSGAKPGEASCNLSPHSAHAVDRKGQAPSFRLSSGDGESGDSRSASLADRCGAGEETRTVEDSRAAAELAPLHARPGWGDIGRDQLVTVAYDRDDPSRHTAWIAVRAGEAATQEEGAAFPGKLIVFDTERQGADRAVAVAGASAGLLLLGALKLYISLVLRKRLILVPGK